MKFLCAFLSPQYAGKNIKLHSILSLFLFHFNQAKHQKYIKILRQENKKKENKILGYLSGFFLISLNSKIFIVGSFFRPPELSQKKPSTSVSTVFINIIFLWTSSEKITCWNVRKISLEAMIVHFMTLVEI